MTPAAPSIPESPAAATSSAPSSAPSSALAGVTNTPIAGTPAFDAILMLQSLAATPEGLQTEAGETTDLLGLEDSEDDEDNAEELEASLAFLAQLLTVTSSRQGARDFETGGQPQGEAQDAQAPVQPAKADALLAAANGTLPDGKKDGEAMLTPVRTEPLEARVTGDASQNLARAAEILSSVTRPGADVEKAALTTPARDPRWADELGARVSLMVRARESTASLQLTPVDLGPVEVNVTVKDSQATVHFGASQAETRALLEAAMPRLREMLAAQGFQLTDSSVSSGFARSQSQERGGEARAGAESETSTTESRAVRSLGLLDLYA